MTLDEIKYRLHHFLFGNKLWHEFAPYRNNDPLNSTQAKKAAVAIHISLLNGEIIIILIERSAYNGKHSQQIAFPGGKKDSTDMNLEHTARRESTEEIGFGLKDGELIGELTEIYIPVSGFRVTPFVFFHKEIPNTVLNEREVKSIILCKLKDIDTQTKKIFKNITINNNLILKNIPGIEYENHFIWGATVLILHEFNTAVKTF